MGRLVGLGIFIAAFGVGSLVLPLFGLQFRIFMILEELLGSMAWLGSLGLVAAGVGLVVLDKKTGKAAPK